MIALERSELALLLIAVGVVGLGKVTDMGRQPRTRFRCWARSLEVPQPLHVEIICQPVKVRFQLSADWYADDFTFFFD
jgi:hypothetical protein